MLQGQNDLGSIEFCSFFTKSYFILQVPEQFAPIHEIGYKIQIGSSLEGELETDKERTGLSLDQNIFFCERMLDFTTFNQILFMKDFHCVNTTSIFLAYLKDLA